VKLFEGLTKKQVMWLALGALLLAWIGFNVLTAILVSRDNRLWTNVMASVNEAIPRKTLHHVDSYAENAYRPEADYCMTVDESMWSTFDKAKQTQIETQLMAAVGKALRGSRYATVHFHITHAPARLEFVTCAPALPLYLEYATMTATYGDPGQNQGTTSPTTPR
jgi:hypothetical protein